MDSYFDEIFEYTNSLEIIDTHEHLPTSEESRDRDTDILKEYLHHYFKSDLISAGLNLDTFKRVVDCRIPLMERWKLVEPYWEAARNTGYARALDITAKGLYGIDRICSATLEELNGKFIKSLEGGQFEKVLKEKSKIKVSLLVSDHGCDKKYFRSVCSVDRFIRPDFIIIDEVERSVGTRVCSFSGWLEVCKEFLERELKDGAVAFKSGLAYFRTLKYRRVTYSEAEADFNELISNRYLHKWDACPSPGQKLQNYMMHFILQEADKRNLTFQFHTGLQEGNGNFISNSDPSLLSNLFLEYPGVDFDIFHIGYPYQQTLSALAKQFPNVFIDMCWAHIISPTACVNALAEWLDAVPANKISAFGGDYCFIDGVYGHQYMARINVSKALALKVREGDFDVLRAKQLSKMLFYDNPLRIFKLEGSI